MPCLTKRHKRREYSPIHVNDFREKPIIPVRALEFVR